MKNLILLSFSVLLYAGCGPRTDEPQPGPPVTAIVPIAGLPLDSALAMLQTELKAAIDNNLDDTGLGRFRRAEAMTDRLLETRYPFQWLTGQSYSVESKLRQIQALTDRVLAEMRSGVSSDSALVDLRLTQAEVVWLRQALRGGGGAAPPDFEKLMAGRDTIAPPPAAGGAEPVEGH